ncbi:hypothetical protein PGT21_033630 [Puccinia graminis f. sp. tritici]|uniref:Uncharacterized protein n=1 Tax=Puccinia graminis f. sp. tritici TaxID=56615 RepID=A0A5B0RI30_PUCGR|nr:hypothetical protein PGT21_033630 [Puccinia graminis f. sp. tritici]KAA1125601.1 hypothetical protein PGTUg99_008422 [Puccinia graminis f. sp. tritici]
MIRMNRAYHPWLLGITFYLISCFEFSFCNPPTSDCAPLVSSAIDALGHESEFNFHDRELGHDYFQLSRGQGRVSKTDTAVDLIEPTILNTWNIGFNPDDHDGWWEEISNDLGDGSKPDTLRAITPDQMEQNMAGGDDQIDTSQIKTSKKRLGKVPDNKFKLDQELESMGEPLQSNLRPEKRPCRSVDERRKLVRCASNHKPGDFEIIALDSKWDPLLAWAQGSLGETADSAVMHHLVLCFGKQVKKINEKLTLAKPYRKVEFRELPIDFILADSPDTNEPGCHYFLIQPKGLRGQSYHFSRKLNTIKVQFVGILEALGLYHGLSILYGVDKRILGHKMKDSLEDLVNWFWGIFFEEAEDGPAIFGWFKGTWEAAKQAGNEFGSIKKVMLLILANWNWSKISFNHKSEIALSLLGFWYKTKADMKFGLEKFGDKVPEIYWNAMAEINQIKLKSWKQIEINFLHEDNVENRSVTYKETNEVSKLIFNSMKLHLQNENSGIEQSLRTHIKNKVHDFVSRSRFDLCYERMISLNGLPICLIPVATAQRNSINQEFFIGLRGIEDLPRKRQNKSRIIENRTTQIIQSLYAIHSLATEVFSDQEKNILRLDDLIKWFLNIIFDQTDSRLPLFGWVAIQSNHLHSPNKLFSNAQKYLSVKLNESGTWSMYTGMNIAISVFGFWYEEMTLIKSNLNYQGGDQDHSFQNVLNKMDNFATQKDGFYS